MFGLLGLSLLGAVDARASITVDFENTTGTPYTDFKWTGWTGIGTSGENHYVIGQDGATVSRADGLAFAFEGADFASVAGTSITVTGWRSGQKGASQTFDVSGGNSFRSFTSDLAGVDTLTFSGSGWKMDNFIDSVSVPEPGTMIAGALLLLPFGASTLRFVRKNRTA
jgi:hypothetical protein